MAFSIDRFREPAQIILLADHRPRVQVEPPEDSYQISSRKILGNWLGAMEHTKFSRKISFAPFLWFAFGNVVGAVSVWWLLVGRG
jgi:hypothetical protein